MGSRLVGQPFSDPKYFWSRPSATSPQPYNGLSSGGSNLGPLNPALTNAVKANIAALQAADPTNHAPVPVDKALPRPGVPKPPGARATVAPSVAIAVSQARCNAMSPSLLAWPRGYRRRVWR